MNDELLDILVTLVALSTADRARKEDRLISDKISSDIGTYFVETGPMPLSTEYVTILAVEQKAKNGKVNTIGPCGVQKYDSFEEAKEGHEYWRNLCVTNPPLFFHDVVTNENYSVPL